MVEHRSPKPGVAGSIPATPARFKVEKERQEMARPSPGEFVRQVRQEFAKVTWPSAKERNVTTVMVLIMVFIMAMFFLGIDQVLSAFIQWVLGIGN